MHYSGIHYSGIQMMGFIQDYHQLNFHLEIGIAAKKLYSGTETDYCVWNLVVHLVFEPSAY